MRVIHSAGEKGAIDLPVSGQLDAQPKALAEKSPAVAEALYACWRAKLIRQPDYAHDLLLLNLKKVGQLT